MFALINFKSAFSYQHSLISVSDAVNLQLSRGYDIPVLADYNLSGMLEFFKSCKDANKTGLISLATRLSIEKNSLNILIFPRNFTAFHLLLKKYKEIDSNQSIDFDFCFEHKDDFLFVISEQNTDLLKTESAQIMLEKLSAFNVYYLLDFAYSKEQIKEVEYIVKNYNIALLPGFSAEYSEVEHIKAHEYLRKINGSVDKEIANHFLQTAEELKELIQEYNSILLDNLDDFLDQIQLFDYELPKFEIPQIYPNPNEEIKKRVYEFCVNLGPEYQERAKHELSVITELNFANYFLLVSEICRWAKANDVLIGPGRGSAVGSLVAWALGITEIDPVKHNLIFERFLNKFRQGYPDIDIDVDSADKLKVVKYLTELFGNDKIAFVNTQNKYLEKSALNDVVRILAVSESEKREIKREVEGKLEYYTKPLVREVSEVCKTLYGKIQTFSTHASALIVSNVELTEYLAVKKSPYGDFNQLVFDMNELESIGLLKLDLLSLNNLTVLKKQLNYVKKIDPDFKGITDFENQNTFKLIAKSDTEGIFQLETEGLKRLCRRMQTKTFSDLIDTLALWRPGALDQIDVYIENKKKGSFETDLPEEITEIIKSTNGIILYQEQIIEIAKKIGGYSFAEADLFRRAISKKDQSVIEKEHPLFLKKATANGYSLEVAEKIFAFIKKFAEYGFNKSHSVGYATLAYQMAYIKANYFNCFAAAFFQLYTGDSETIVKYVFEAKLKGYFVLNPRILISGKKCKLSQNKILLPLTVVKRISSEIVEQLNSQKYTDFVDFLIKTKDILSQEQLENLIFASTLDGFSLTKKQMRDLAMMRAHTALLSDYKKDESEYSDSELSDFEFKALGFNLKYDLLNKLAKEKYFVPFSEIERRHSITTIAKIKNQKVFKSAKGTSVAKFELVHANSAISCTAFNVCADKINDLLQKGSDIVKVNVNRTIYKDTVSYIVVDISEYTLTN